MVSTQLTVTTTPTPPAARQPDNPDPALTQAFQALLQTALQSEGSPVAESPKTPPEAVEAREDSVPADEGGAAVDKPQPEQADKPAKPVPPAELEQPDPALALAAVPVHIEPAPELLEVPEAEIQTAGSIPFTAKLAQPEPAQPQPAQGPTPQHPEPEQPASEVPILSTELIVGEPGPLEEAALPIPIEADPEAQSRFDEMLARASEQLQGPAEDNRAREVEPPAQQPEPPPTGEEGVRDAEPAQREAQTVRRQPGGTERRTDSAPEYAATVSETEPAPMEPVRFEPLERQSLFPTPAEQIEARVMENLETQRMEFRMQLQPQELGRVDVRMVLEGGKLAVQIIAATPRAAEALKGQAEGLIASMRTANIDLDSVQVVQETAAKEQHMYGGFDTMGQSDQPQDQPQGDTPRAAHTAAEEPAQAGTVQDLPETLLDTAV